MRRTCTLLALLLSCLLRIAGTAAAQAVPTASGPGAFASVGGGFSRFQADYGHQELAGTFFYADVNPHWRVGLEGEARFLRYGNFEQVTESNLLGGVRVRILRAGRLQPYAKFLAGMGRIALPLGYAHGSFLAYAPGAGLDIAVTDRITVRPFDLEYQHWPQFTFGALSPYGVSAGVSLRLNPVGRYPRSLRTRR